MHAPKYTTLVLRTLVPNKVFHLTPARRVLVAGSEAILQHQRRVVNLVHSSVPSKDGGLRLKRA